MKPRIIFITGTDTNAGKTVLATLLARHLRAHKISVAAYKPVCSGGRDDAKVLHSALGGALALDEINPWHFRKAVAPLLAAQAERRKVMLGEVVAHARLLRQRFPVLIVEGAGGLLSPLGEDFDSSDLIQALRATPVVVAPNRLGAINQVLLTLAALPRGLAQKAQVVLVSQSKPDPTVRGNIGYLARKLGRQRMFELPWLNLNSAAGHRRASKTLAALTRSLGL